MAPLPALPPVGDTPQLLLPAPEPAQQKPPEKVVPSRLEQWSAVAMPALATIGGLGDVQLDANDLPQLPALET